MPSAKTASRKKFLYWGLGILSALAAARFTGLGRRKQTVKMLTEDGKLVEVDKRLLPRASGKITNEGLQRWVKTNRKS